MRRNFFEIKTCLITKTKHQTDAAFGAFSLFSFFFFLQFIVFLHLLLTMHSCSLLILIYKMTKEISNKNTFIPMNSEEHRMKSRHADKVTVIPVTNTFIYNACIRHEWKLLSVCVSGYLSDSVYFLTCEPRIAIRHSRRHLNQVLFR